MHNWTEGRAPEMVFFFRCLLNRKQNWFTVKEKLHQTTIIITLSAHQKDRSRKLSNFEKTFRNCFEENGRKKNRRIQSSTIGSVWQIVAEQRRLPATKKKNAKQRNRILFSSFCFCLISVRRWMIKRSNRCSFYRLLDAIWTRTVRKNLAFLFYYKKKPLIDSQNNQKR